MLIYKLSPYKGILKMIMIVSSFLNLWRHDVTLYSYEDI
jgi:hypothetical protein